MGACAMRLHARTLLGAPARRDAVAPTLSLRVHLPLSTPPTQPIPQSNLILPFTLEVESQPASGPAHLALIFKQ